MFYFSLSLSLLVFILLCPNNVIIGSLTSFILLYSISPRLSLLVLILDLLHPDNVLRGSLTSFILLYSISPQFFCTINYLTFSYILIIFSLALFSHSLSYTLYLIWFSCNSLIFAIPSFILSRSSYFSYVLLPLSLFNILFLFGSLVFSLHTNALSP